jgi:hypothetical protein
MRMSSKLLEPKRIVSDNKFSSFKKINKKLNSPWKWNSKTKMKNSEV